ncbi:MAG: histidine kinase [Candidatus Acidiferrum sp.]
MAPHARIRGELLWRAGIIPLAVGSVLAVGTAIECHAVAPSRNTFSSWILSLIYGAMLWLWWAGVIELLWRAGKRWPLVLRVSLGSAGLHLLAGASLTLIHLGILQSAVYAISKVGPRPEQAVYGSLHPLCLPRFGIELLMYGIVWFACTAVNTQLASQREAMRALELERQLSTAHLQALQMQLEPHFLFNTLNALTALVELNRSDEALGTLAHLNTILKSGLKRSTPGKIPLAQELEIVESYLAIERLRFADRLRVDINLDPAALDGLVPCFLLQPIIENAIRHGISQCENEGFIETSAKRVGPRLQLLVRDNGPGNRGKSDPGFGVGLSNTRKRLAHFYQNNYEFCSSSGDAGGFEVSITIPYEKTGS